MRQSIEIYVGRLRPLLPELAKRLKAKGLTVSGELRKVLARMLKREGIDIEGHVHIDSADEHNRPGGTGNRG